jgi:hypothetical protein
LPEDSVAATENAEIFVMSREARAISISDSGRSSEK